jgi:hypothetical protein
VGITKESLPSPVGDLYTGVVLACLCCLDESGENLFLGEKGVVDRDGIAVGVRYIENVSESMSWRGIWSQVWSVCCRDCGWVGSA